jgi:hypothetical protein
MGHSTFRIALFAVIVAIASDVMAGTALLERKSSIRASGTLGTTDYNLLDSSQDFSGFSDLVTTNVGTSGDGISANQHSRPAMRDSNFLGAYAEGSANAAVGPQDVADASSNFDLTFEVLNTPAVVTFGGAAGVAGSGATSVTLTNETTGERIMDQQFINAHAQKLDYSTLLSPGVYALCVEALATGESAGGMAFYTMSVDLSPVTDAPAAVPLPSAVWAAGSMLAIGGMLRGFKNFRQRPVLA